MIPRHRASVRPTVSAGGFNGRMGLSILMLSKPLSFANKNGYYDTGNGNGDDNGKDRRADQKMESSNSNSNSKIKTTHAQISNYPPIYRTVPVTTGRPPSHKTIHPTKSVKLGYNLSLSLSTTSLEEGKEEADTPSSDGEGQIRQERRRTGKLSSRLIKRRHHTNDNPKTPNRKRDQTSLVSISTFHTTDGWTIKNKS